MGKIKLRDISDFTDKEYKQQAQNANFSKLSNIMGFKPTANKVLNTVMFKNINAWQKVEVLANATSLETLYMGGSTNIEGVIVNICSDYTGSNNIPLLESKGDFGARLNNAPAASRYIFTKSSSNFDALFNKVDLNVLPRYNFENTDIEYQFLTFNLPMLLINGSEGMGSGHAQKILPRDPAKIKQYIVDKLKGKLRATSDNALHPFYKGFKGTIEPGENSKQWIFKGVFEKMTSAKLKITEVPIGETYKSYIKKLDALVDRGVIKRYDDLCDPKTDIFLFTVYHSIDFGKKVTLETLKLVSKVSENFTVIDENNSVVVHDSAKDIIDHYYDIKMHFLQKRKDYLMSNTLEKIDFDNSRYLFIKAIVEDRLKINKRKKTDIETDVNNIDGIIKRDGSYGYLLSMPIYNLTIEKMQELQASILKLKNELETIKIITLEQMWLNDLKGFKG